MVGGEQIRRAVEGHPKRAGLEPGMGGHGFAAPRGPKGTIPHDAMRPGAHEGVARELAPRRSAGDGGADRRRLCAVPPHAAAAGHRAFCERGFDRFAVPRGTKVTIPPEPPCYGPDCGTDTGWAVQRWCA